MTERSKYCTFYSAKMAKCRRCDKNFVPLPAKNRITMKKLSIAVLTAIVAGCTPHPAERPEGPTPEPAAAGMYFAASNPHEIVATKEGGSFTVTLGRLDGSLDSDESFGLRAECTGVRVALPSSGQFAAGDATCTVAGTYGAIAPGMRAELTLRIVDANTAPGLPAVWHIELIAPDERPEALKGLYVHACRSHEVTYTVARGTDAAVYTVAGEGFARTIRLANDGGVTLAAAEAGLEEGTVAQCADLRTQAEASGVWIDNIYKVENSFAEAEGRFNLAVCYTDGEGRRKPDIDFFFTDPDGGEWSEPVAYTFVDGWFLPAVSVNAMLYNPDEHPWEVAVQRSRVRPGVWRVLNLYRGASPLSTSNITPADCVMEIDASDAENVIVAPQPSPFYCPDIHPAPPYIGGRGMMSADGTITLPAPEWGLSPEALHSRPTPHRSVLRPLQ